MAQSQQTLTPPQSQSQSKTILPPVPNKTTKEFQSLWNEEYTTLKTLPSSTRIVPSKSIQLFSEILLFDKVTSVLDAGCGIGRNSVYFAQKGCQISAVDCSEVALAELDRNAKDAGVAGKITPYNSFLSAEFPFENDMFDLSLDCYVLCHFESDEFRSGYRDELFRVTKPGGYVISTVISNEDAYYRRFIDSESNSMAVTDPSNGITKRLYTESEINSFFEEKFELSYCAKFGFQEAVAGENFRGVY